MSERGETLVDALDPSDDDTTLEAGTATGGDLFANQPLMVDAVRDDTIARIAVLRKEGWHLVRGCREAWAELLNQISSCIDLRPSMAARLLDFPESERSARQGELLDWVDAATKFAATGNGASARWSGLKPSVAGLKVMLKAAIACKEHFKAAEHRKLVSVYARLSQAESALVAGNARLVYKVLACMPYVQKGIYEDLFQEGMAAMLHCISRYDPVKARFSTYAMPWIKQGVQRYMYSHSGALRLPSNVGASCARISAAESRLRGLAQRAPTDAELADAAQMSTAELRAMREVPRVFLSLDTPVDGADRLTLVDVIHDQAAEDREAEEDDLDDKRAQVRALLSGLKPTECLVVSKLFGLAGVEEMTAKAVAAEMGQSVAWVEKLYARAATSMRGGVNPASRADRLAA